MELIIPLEPIPNQTITTTIHSNVYEFQIISRLGKLYMSAWMNGNLELMNRVLLDARPVSRNLCMIDTQGNSDPFFEELGSRFLLVWFDND